jgi:hypothetical protein
MSIPPFKERESRARTSIDNGGSSSYEGSKEAESNNDTSVNGCHFEYGMLRDDG